MRPIDIVRKVAPRARKAYLDAFENGDALFQKHGITTPLRLAHFLAQILHESGGLTVEWENMRYRAPRILEIFGVGRHSAKVTPAEAAKLAGNPPALAERVYGLGNPKKAKELGNLRPGDGSRYRGGGLMQTTGRANYRRMGQKCGVDFENHPELLLSAEHALKPALAEWTEGKLNDRADKNDISGITRRINGGYNGLDDRKRWFMKVRPLCEGLTLEPQKAPQEPVETPLNIPPPSSPPTPAPAPTPTPEPEKKGWFKRTLEWIFGGGLATLGFGSLFNGIWTALDDWRVAAIVVGAVAALIVFLVVWFTDFGKAKR